MICVHVYFASCVFHICIYLFMFYLVFCFLFLFFLIIRRPPRSTRTDTLFPYTTLFRSGVLLSALFNGIPDKSGMTRRKMAPPSSRGLVGRYLPRSECAAERSIFRFEPRLVAAGEIAGLIDPIVADDAAREIAELRVDRRDIGVGPAGDLFEAGDAEALEQGDELRADALEQLQIVGLVRGGCGPRRGWFGRSEAHTSELQSLMRISYAVFCLKKKNSKQT